jgi:rhodanese-related sulfurtransferase
MKKIIIIALTLIGIGALFLLVSSPTDSKNINDTSSKSITMSTIDADINTGSVMLDVRTPEEFSSGYIDGAVNLPLDKIQSGQAPYVDKSKPLYVYCRSGNRSAQATVTLKNAGYTNVVDLGSMEDIVVIGGKVIN